MEKSINKIDDCKLNCFDNKTQKVCEIAPCQKSKDRFGMHERIVDHYISNESWSLAYYFLIDLIHLFRINCDYTILEKLRIKDPNRELELKEYPLGCRIFKVSELLKIHLKDLNYYSSLIKEKGIEKIGDEGKKLFENAKRKFTERMNQSLTILSHLVMSVEFDRFEKNSYFEKGINFLDKAIEAKEKYGIDIKVPNLIEQEWEKNTKAAGYDPEKEKRRVKNETRLKEAKRKALMDKIQKKLIKGEEIDEELKKKLIELTGDD